MPLPDQLGFPEWVDSGARPIRGLDLLGLRLPVQNVGNTLINGVTTVTPTIRYLSFRAWIARAYAEARLPDSWESFRDYAARCEAAIVLANLLRNPQTSGLIGPTIAASLVDSGQDPLPLQSLVKQLAVAIYTGPSDQLGITFTSDSGVPGLSVERGVPLADTCHLAFSNTALGTRLSAGERIPDAARQELGELTVAASVEAVPDSERDLLIEALIPTRPLPADRNRVCSYALLLSLAKEQGRLPLELDLFEAALRPRTSMTLLFAPVLDGWLQYCVRDMLAVCHEAVLEAVVHELEMLSQASSQGVSSERVLGEMLARTSDQEAALRDLRVLSDGESSTSLSFEQLKERIETQTSADNVEANGIRRWGGHLREPNIYGIALSGAGALAALPVAWLIALRRFDERAIEDEQRLPLVSHQAWGWSRIGLQQVVLPECRRFLRERRSLMDVSSELARRTVEQHLRVAWSRMATDARRDVAVLVVDGDEWVLRRGFRAGRTASRIDQAIGWLRQLRLIDDRGITTDGDAVLAPALERVREFAVAA